MAQPGRESEPISDAAADRRSSIAPKRTVSPESWSSDENERSREPTHDSRTVAGGSQYASPAPASRKRRRITRACDDCRRKKIKCDGKQPCESCADFHSGKPGSHLGTLLEFQTNLCSQSARMTGRQPVCGGPSRGTCKRWRRDSRKPRP